ncbi:PH domain-containing protein [Candidatus Pacearchaeota archaeon]|nr:PH domain-containing protein [Candidatus Pacearchaeota archaeon]
MKRQLHSGARWIFRLRGIGIAIFLSVFIGWFLGFIAAAALTLILGQNAVILAAIFMVLFWIIIVLAIAEIYARMAYNRWFYEFTPDNLKIEKGIIWKKYSNIPYERVQNVDITRGIFARIFGFSSVNIQTAGYSGYGRGMPMSEGYIPGVDIDEAEKIREFLMKKISKKNSGL